MQYLAHERKVIYKARDKKISKVFPVVEWLAAMCSHIPNSGEQMASRWRDFDIFTTMLIIQQARIQDVFVQSYLSNNIACLKKVLDKCLRIRYMTNHVTLYSVGNRVEPFTSPCTARPSV